MKQDRQKSLSLWSLHSPKGKQHEYWLINAWLKEKLVNNKGNIVKIALQILKFGNVE